jgi:hypothetical protein
MRQRVRTRTSRLAPLGLALLTVLALGLIWYGAMVVLLAAKISPVTVNEISDYRTAYDYFGKLDPADIDSRVRLIAGLAGLATFLVCSYLAAKTVSRTHFARTQVTLDSDDRGVVTIQPRAIERAIEVAALGHDAVRGAAGRKEDEALTLNVALARASDAAETLRDLRRRARAALGEHDLLVVPVNVTLTAFYANKGRELE